MSKAKINQLPAATNIDPADLIPIWQTSTGTTKQAPASSLPTSGGGSTTALGSPFAVYNGDANYVINGANSEITDIRLLGKTGYSVTTNEINLYEFRRNQLVYDAAHGKVTILNYILPVGDYSIRIYADGVTSSPNYNTILTDLTLIKQVLAPFFLLSTGINGAVLLWNKPANLIPPGWQEWIDMRGKMPVGVDPSDTDFSTVGATGGGKDHIITAGELPSGQKIGIEKSGDEAGGFGLASTGAFLNRVLVSGANDNTGMVKLELPGNDDPFSLLNPFRVVLYIQFIGV